MQSDEFHMFSDNCRKVFLGKIRALKKQDFQNGKVDLSYSKYNA